MRRRIASSVWQDSQYGTSGEIYLQDLLDRAEDMIIEDMARVRVDGRRAGYKGMFKLDVGPNRKKFGMGVQDFTVSISRYPLFEMNGTIYTSVDSRGKVTSITKINLTLVDGEMVNNLLPNDIDAPAKEIMETFSIFIHEEYGV